MTTTTFPPRTMTAADEADLRTSASFLPTIERLHAELDAEREAHRAHVALLGAALKKADKQQGDLDVVLEVLVAAIEKVGPWDSETRVGLALKEAHAVLDTLNGRPLKVPR